MGFSPFSNKNLKSGL